MSKMFTPIIILQSFCLYHAYVNKRDYKWFFLIFFLPLIGSLLYLYNHVYSRRKLEDISEIVKGNLVPNYTVDKLIREAEVSDTITNKLRLADEYYNNHKMEQAMVLYESCATGLYADDIEINKKLVLTYYENEKYTDAVRVGKILSRDKDFQNSYAQLAYAWSLFYNKAFDEAQIVFDQMNKSYTNHHLRHEYALFLIDTNQINKAQLILNELSAEINNMESHEKRLKKQVINNIKTTIRNNKFL